MTTGDNVSVLHGVGKELARRLKRLKVETVGDLIYHYPRRYQDFSKISAIADIKAGPVTIQGKITQTSVRRTRRGFNITEAIIDDGAASIKAVWFNQPYLAKQLPKDKEVYVAGELQLSYNQYALQNPAVEPVSSFPKDTARIVPIYPETEGVSSKQIRRLVKQILPLVADVENILPKEVIKPEKLLSRAQALKQLHFPSGTQKLELARLSLAFEELFLLILAGLAIKGEVESEPAPKVKFDEAVARKYVKTLGFELTDGQRAAAWQILQDLERGHPMNRLLEGDVGSGKTVVAVMAAVQAAKSGLQSALMVPTEILARQHYDRLKPLLNKFSVTCELVVGGSKAEAKQSAYDAIKEGRADIAIGTHALLQSDVSFQDLGLVIIDEQHRFGVKQRQQLKQKAGPAYRAGRRLPHLLSMTATPIPRSLALAVYGDLDISVIKELPPGRKPVRTNVASEQERPRVYQHIDDEIKKGRQVFVVCPIISESDKLGVKSVEQEASRLRDSIFKSRRIEVMHGRLKPQDKEQIMTKFAAGKIDILVTTTVVEVGVDIPNATVMLVEGAERFGLATLHQLRGRIGRSDMISHCYLLATNNGFALKRLKLLARYSDGFRLAAEDLKLRGPGQIYGTQQHGLLSLKIADITDVELVARVRQAANEFFKDKQNLVQYPRIAQQVNKLKTVTSLD